MDTTKRREAMAGLRALKREAGEEQKKGLPFMLASVVLWGVFLLVQWTCKEITIQNLYTFLCSCLLMPLAFLFSKLLKADIFKKTDNPINKLGFLCTMNQMLYILIAMWAFSKSPENMLMIYAMIFGAHLLPFAWVYDCKPYIAASIVDTLGALVTAQLWGNRATALFFVIAQAMLCLALLRDLRKGRMTIEG
ncbi:MAG: hypothetical protein IKI69_02820 [Oscillospiraceae bacterium]|nr:hypothetical protein [Oscillospiraceae bacterium]